MFILFFNQGSSGLSTDPGEGYVVAGTTYYINGVFHTGTLSLLFPTPAEMANAVWESTLTSHTTSGTFGAFIQKLLTVGKFLGLK